MASAFTYSSTTDEDRAVARWTMTGLFIGGGIAFLMAYAFHANFEDTGPAAFGGAIGGALALALIRVQLNRARR
jgi:hypothetical protein